MYSLYLLLKTTTIISIYYLCDCVCVPGCVPVCESVHVCEHKRSVSCVNPQMPVTVVFETGTLTGT